MPSGVDLKRALTVTEIGGDGSDNIPSTVLSQPVIDKLITQLVDYNNPVRQNIPRKKGSGFAWHLNRRTPGNTILDFVADTDSIEEGVSVYTQHDFIYKTIATQGKITRKAQAIGQSYINILAEELEAKAMDFRDKEDYNMLWASSSGSTFVGYDANAWNGIFHLADAANRFTGAGASNLSSALSLDLLDQAIDAIRGDCNMIITSKKGRRIINSLLQTQQRFNDKIEVRGGFKVLSYNDIPILTSSNCVDVGGLDIDWYGTATGPGGGNSPGLTSLTTGDMSSIFCIDTSKVFMGVLTELTVQPLAKVSSQYDEFDIYCDEVPVCRDPKAISVIHVDE